MRRQVRARAQPVALEDRRDHPRRRGLAVGARRRGWSGTALRLAERGQQPAHPVQPEAHAEQLQRRAGSARRPRASSARGVDGWAITAPRAPRAAAASLSRSACTTAGRRLGDEALVGELALRARDLALAARRAARRAGARLLLGVDASERRAPRPRRRGPRPSAPALAPRVGAPGAPAARRAAVVRVAVGREPRRELLPGGTPSSLRQARTAVTAAIDAPTSASASASPAPRRRAGQRRAGEQALGARARAPRSPRSRTGSPGGPAPASRAARGAAWRDRSASTSRPLTSSRYQSHSSP